jgi:hypothetical protein
MGKHDNNLRELRAIVIMFVILFAVMLFNSSYRKHDNTENDNKDFSAEVGR